MKRIIFYLIIVVVFSTIYSCKEELPIKNFEESTGLIDSTFVASTVSAPQEKHVLIEEYTGVRCQNCPDGHLKIEEIVAKYGEKIVPVGIHNNSLAEPYKVEEQDFRVPEADVLASEFGISPKPAAIINRTKDANGSFSYNRLKWMEVVDVEVLKKSKVKITPYITSNMDRTDSLLSAKIEFTEAYSNKTSITFLVIESNMIATQYSGQDHIEKYVHKHVLRRIYTSTLGSSLARTGNTYEAGRTFIKQFKLNPNSIWKTENCALVVFVTDDVTKEVLQAAEVKIK